MSNEVTTEPVVAIAVTMTGQDSDKAMIYKHGRSWATEAGSLFILDDAAKPNEPIACYPPGCWTSVGEVCEDESR